MSQFISHQITELACLTGRFISILTPNEEPIHEYT
jgi:hypothetical protein